MIFYAHSSLVPENILPDFFRLGMGVYDLFKDEIMEKFRNQEFQVLISTTVIEVGVDVPNATVMVVEHSERFGLSQLH